MYKVVLQEDGKFFSTLMRKESGLQVEYKLEEFVRPPQAALDLGYGLCVFETKHDAVMYAQYDGPYFHIFECETVPMKNQPRAQRLWMDAASLENIVLNDIHSHHKTNWSTGCVLVEAVKLLKEVPCQL